MIISNKNLINQNLNDQDLNEEYLNEQDLNNIDHYDNFYSLNIDEICKNLNVYGYLVNQKIYNKKNLYNFLTNKDNFISIFDKILDYKNLSFLKFLIENISNDFITKILETEFISDSTKTYNMFFKIFVLIKKNRKQNKEFINSLKNIEYFKDYIISTKKQVFYRKYFSIFCKD
jgi:hypothetical protein